jgi:hypothetical protein
MENCSDNKIPEHNMHNLIFKETILGGKMVYVALK